MGTRSEDVDTDWSSDTATRDTAQQAEESVSGLSTEQETGHFTGPGMVLKDRFVLGERLGGGPMGQIHGVRDRTRPEGSPGPPLAVKLVPTRAGGTALEGLLREAALARRLSHANIVRVHDMDRDGDHAFMTMERLEGESLAKILDARRRRPMPRVQALQVIEGLCRALAHCHDLGIVHGDVKPGNIFVTSDGHARLLDFGVARDLNATDTTPHGHTPEYASCEVIEGSPALPADDLYSVACVAYRMLAGRRPFGRLNALEAREAGMRPDRIDALTASQWRAVEQALSHRRDARQPDVTTFIAQIKGPRDEVVRAAGAALAERAGADAAEPAEAAADAAPERSFLKRPSTLAGLAAGAAVLAVVAALLPAGRSGAPEATTGFPVPTRLAADARTGVLGPARGNDLSRLHQAPDLSGAIAAREEPPAPDNPRQPDRSPEVASAAATAVVAEPAAAGRREAPAQAAATPARAPVTAPLTAPVKGPPVPDDAIAGAVAPGDEWPYPPLPPAFAAANPAALTGAGRSGATADTAVPAEKKKPDGFAGEIAFGDLELRRYVEPDYPPLQANREIPGWVDVGFTVTRHGRTTDATVIEADPPGDFDTAALIAVRRWRFASPPGGEDVRTRVRVRFTPVD